MTDETRDYLVSSGNVFADAGRPDADERLARARLMRRITMLIRERGLTQREASALLGVPQPHISLLLRGRMSSFSLERLLHMLTALGTDVTISYQPSRSAIGHLTIIGDEAADDDCRSLDGTAGPADRVTAS
jgi:predicted XRE-type DNA-binding protein